MKALTTVLRLGLVFAVFAAVAMAGPSASFAEGEPIDIEILSVDDTAFPEIQAVIGVSFGGRPFVEFVNDSVTVTEDSLAAEVNTVVRAIDGDIPLSVVLAIDTSGSMAGLSIDQAKQAASSLVGSLAEQDFASLLSFSDNVEAGPVASVDRELLMLAIAELSARGNTALYDATTAAAELAASSGGARNAVILLSDGEDFGGRSVATRAESLERAAASGAVFYVIGVGSEIDRDYLTALAETTGGRLFEAVAPADIPTIYQSLEDLLRGQYIVSFTSTATEEARERDLTVTIAIGEQTGTASRSYTSLRRAPVQVEEPAPPPPAAEVPAPVVGPEVVEVEAPEVVPVAVVVPADAGSSYGMAIFVLVGAVIAVAVVAMVIKLRRRPATSAPLESAPLELVRTETVAAGGSAGQLMMIDDSGGAPSVEVGVQPVTVGSSPDCDLQLPEDNAVAPTHGRFWLRDGRLMFHHVAKAYQSSINGSLVEWSSLQDGDEIQMGPFMLRFQQSPAAGTSGGQLPAV